MQFEFDERTEQLILHFDTEFPEIDAQTFANAIIAFDELLRAINGVANPGWDIEIDFTHAESGSIRTFFKIVKKDAKTLAKSPLALILFPFLLNILSNWVSSDPVNIIVYSDSYVVQKGDERIVLPKSSAQVAQRIEASPQVRQKTKNLIAVCEADSNVRSLDIRSTRSPNTPIVPIPRDRFGIIRDLPEIASEALPSNRQLPHIKQKVVVVTAHLERSARKWKFIWNGQKINADIQDVSFFDKLASHEYEFGQGDILTVDMVVDQELNDLVGAYENKGYHITKVHRHQRGPKQGELF